MKHPYFDIIVIGAGSGGLSVGLSMHKIGLKVLLIDRSDRHIGGECLNDGCVPSKALIHVARIIHQAKEAEQFGLSFDGTLDMRKVVDYVYQSQETIRQHENAFYFRSQGLEVALGEAKFTGSHSVAVNGNIYHGKKIVIATGSRPRRLEAVGIEQVRYYDNESIFHINNLPKKLLIVGGGPVGIEMAQAFQRLGSKVIIVHRGPYILKNESTAISDILHQKLENEGIQIFVNAEVTRFSTSTQALITINGINQTINFDAVFVATGRVPSIDKLELAKANVYVTDGNIKTDKYLRTTNKDILVCGDVAGSLKFSHAAEHQARIIVNNLFSPFKKKLNNDHLSWVTFTDPEVATFGLNEQQLQKKKIKFLKLETDFKDDDRAVVENYRYSKLILFISNRGILFKQKILGGTMIAPQAGELIQELILATTTGLSINAIFHKIYPYPVATRINQKIIVDYKIKGLTTGIKKLLKIAYRLAG